MQENNIEQADDGTKLADDSSFITLDLSVGYQSEQLIMKYGINGPVK